MIVRAPTFSQQNPAPTDPRNGPSLAGEITNINIELAALEDSVIQGYVTEINSVAYVSPTSFTVSGNLTAIYIPGRRVRFNVFGSVVFGIVASSVFTLPNTTVTMFTTYGAGVPDPITQLDLAIQPTSVDLSIGHIPTKTYSYSGTIELDLEHYVRHIITLDDDVTLSLLGDDTNKAFMLDIISNGHEVTWWGGTILWPGQTAPTLSTGGLKDSFGFTVDGSASYTGYILGMAEG